MDDRQLFRKFYSKLARESWLRSFLWGLVVGLAAFTVTAFICWALSFNAGIWIALGIAVVAIAAATVVFYFARFRPTSLDVARRLDSLGLEERMITMAEFQKDQTYIAMLQREDAKHKMQTVQPRQLGCHASALSVTLASVAGFLAAAMAVVFALSIYNVLPSGSDVLTPDRQKEFVLVIYEEMDGGAIEGETSQMVEVGSDTQTVLAVADDGYMFSQWSDGYAEPSRQDLNVQEEIIVFAEFVEVGEGDGDGDGEGEPGDEPMDEPQDSDGEDGDGNEGEPEDQPTPPSEGETPGAGSGNPNYDYVDDGSGNGQVDYQEIFGTYYEEAMEELASGNISDALRDFIEAYFNALNR